MTARAPRSIGEYLQQLAAAMYGQDSAVILEALEASEEYLRSEVAACPDKSEGDVLELITSTYGAPEDVAAVYRATATESTHSTPALHATPSGSTWARRSSESGWTSRRVRRA